MLLEDHNLVFDAAGRAATQRIAFFPSLCRLQSGMFLACFQLGSGKHAPDSTIQLCRSSDEGATWHELPSQFETTLAGVPGSLSTPEMVEVEPGRLLLFATWFDRSDPARPLFDPVSEGILHSRLVKAVSQDHGESWITWEPVPTPGLTGCSGTGPIVRWPDGTIAMAFESFKEFDDPRPAKHAAWVMVSGDGGQSFSPPILVAQHPKHLVYYWDQRLCAMASDGEFAALFWTHHLERRRDLRVHLRFCHIRGKEILRQPLRETTIPGQIAAPLRLPDGRLLAFVVDRDRPGTMKLWVSRDGGENWPETEALVVHRHEERAAVTQGRENIDFRQYWEDMGKWTFGHPGIRALAPDRVLVSWYSGSPQEMSVHCARIRVTAMS